MIQTNGMNSSAAAELDIRQSIHRREMTLTQAANSLPGRGYTKKLLRWIRHGVWVGSGMERHKVFLQARKMGGMWFIAPEAIEEFSRCVTPGGHEPQPPRCRERYLRRQRQNRHDRAMESLKAQGF